MNDITIRDFYAGMALAGLLASPRNYGEKDAEGNQKPLDTLSAFVKWAFFAADKMLAERAKHAPEKRGQWKPEEGEEYWTFHMDGVAGELIWKNDVRDKFNLSIGAVFKTKEEVGTYIARLRTAHEKRVI